MQINQPTRASLANKKHRTEIEKYKKLCDAIAKNLLPVDPKGGYVEDHTRQALIEAFQNILKGNLYSDVSIKKHLNKIKAATLSESTRLTKEDIGQILLCFGDRGAVSRVKSGIGSALKTTKK